MAAALLVTVPFPLWAGAADVCLQHVMAEDFEIEVQSVIDLGQGVVMETSSGQGTWSGSQTIAFQHCGSGDLVTAESSSWDEYGSRVSPVNPYDVVAAALASATVYSMSDIAGLLVDQGVLTDRTRLISETCGCAVFYPDLRGTKIAWRPQ